ncbi:STAS domain-containing protein [Actinoplanes sp. GCM10030250]|uniref:STAS domain-containing protein n=1 Tax=Actinoplanes sp. GCM10030250 TaxID=3273376 RepID=UPI00360CEE92
MYVAVSPASEDPQAVVMTVRGNLDLDSAPSLASKLDEALSQPAPRVVVDLSGIEFCDSIGLSTFVVGHNRARAAGGWLRLASPGEFLERLLDTVGLTNRIGVYPSIADALANRPDGPSR